MDLDFFLRIKGTMSVSGALGLAVYADPFYCWSCERFCDDCIDSLCTACWRECMAWCGTLFTVNVAIGDISYLVTVAPRDDVQEVVQEVTAMHALTQLLVDRRAPKKRRTNKKK